MKHAIHLLILLFAINICSQNVVEKLSGEEIIRRHIEAIGGQEKLRSVMDETTKMKTTAPGVDMTLEIIKKYPNKYYQKLIADTFTQEVIFNGKRGKTVEFNQVKLFDEAENIRMQEQSHLHLFFSLLELGIMVNRLDDEIVNQIDCYTVEFTFNSGVVWKQYFDKETFYMIRQIIPIHTDRGVFQQIVDFYDYREYSGIMYAGRVRQLMGPQTVEMEVESIDVNTGVEDSFFDID